MQMHRTSRSLAKQKVRLAEMPDFPFSSLCLRAEGNSVERNQDSQRCSVCSEKFRSGTRRHSCNKGVAA